MTYLHASRRRKFAFDRLKQVIQELGLLINQDKVFEPADKMICIGFEVNVKERTVRIPDEKMEQIVAECVSFQNQSRVTRQSLQSLLGKLLYLAKITVPAQAFLNQMLWHLRKQQGLVIYLGRSFHQDLAWFITLLREFYQSPTFKMLNDHDAPDVYVDAPLEGFGGHRQGYAYRIPHSIRINRTILHFEMYNVCLALNHWAHQLRDIPFE